MTAELLMVNEKTICDLVKESILGLMGMYLLEIEGRTKDMATENICGKIGEKNTRAGGLRTKELVEESIQTTRDANTMGIGLTMKCTEMGSTPGKMVPFTQEDESTESRKVMGNSGSLAGGPTKDSGRMGGTMGKEGWSNLMEISTSARL